MNEIDAMYWVKGQIECLFLSLNMVSLFHIRKKEEEGEEN